MLLRCPKTDFFHGGVPFGEGMVVYFYFQDIDLGMIIASPSPIDGGTAFVRMSAFAVPEGAAFVRAKGSA